MTDLAEDRHWICGSVTQVLTGMHHINLVVLKGIKDKAKPHKMTSEKKSERDQGSNNGMKDNFSLQLNVLFKRKIKGHNRQICQSSYSAFILWKLYSLQRGDADLSHSGYSTHRCTLLLLKQYFSSQMVIFPLIVQVLNTLYNRKYSLC